MLEEQIKYLEAARNSGSLFYTRQKGEEEHFFTLKDRPDAAWLEKKTANWHYVLYEPDELPVQGWKIHLSATVKQAQGMLDAAKAGSLSRFTHAARRNLLACWQNCKS